MCSTYCSASWFLSCWSASPCFSSWSVGVPMCGMGWLESVMHRPRKTALSGTYRFIQGNVSLTKQDCCSFIPFLQTLTVKKFPCLLSSVVMYEAQLTQLCFIHHNFYTKQLSVGQCSKFVDQLKPVVKPPWGNLFPLKQNSRSHWFLYKLLDFEQQ